MAGLRSSGVRTSSPWPPSASTIWSYRVSGRSSAATEYPYRSSIGCFSSAQMPLLPITATTSTPWRASVSNSMPLKPNAPSPTSRTTWRRGVRELGGERVARAAPQTAERPGVEPAAGRVRVHDAARERDEVSAVADDDRVAVEHAAQLRVQPHRVQRRAIVRVLGRLRGTALALGR